MQAGLKFVLVLFIVLFELFKTVQKVCSFCHKDSYSIKQPILLDCLYTPLYITYIVLTCSSVNVLFCDPHCMYIC